MAKEKVCALTTLEEELMELFWMKNEPLTSVDIPVVAVGHTWNDSYLHILLKSLLKKGMIKVCGMVQYGSQYARQFIPAITKEEYLAKLIISKGLDKSLTARFAVAMAKELNKKEEDQDELIAELEEMINQLRERQAKKK